MNKTNWKRNFYTIWLGQAVSIITSAALQMAIIWYLTARTGSAMILSLATMAGFLPQALFGSMIGVLVDRMNRKHVMICADLAIAGVGLALAVISHAMELPVWMIMLALFLRSIGASFHSPALSAITPLLVPADQLAKCAGYTQSIQSASFILSPALAGFIYAAWGLNAAIALDVLGALAAVAAVAAVAIPKLPPPGSAQKTHFFAEMREGYRAVRSDKALYCLLWIGAIFMFVYMPVGALFPLMTMGYFGGTAVHSAIAEIAMAVGMLAGGLILGVWGGFKKRAISVVGSVALMGAALTLSGVLPTSGFVPFAVCTAAMGLASPFYNGVHMALLQERIAPEYLGRVFGLTGSIMSLAMPLGLIAAGLLADKVGVNVWFAWSGVGILAIAGLCAALKPIREL